MFLLVESIQYGIGFFYAPTIHVPGPIIRAIIIALTPRNLV